MFLILVCFVGLSFVLSLCCVCFFFLSSFVLLQCLRFSLLFFLCSSFCVSVVVSFSVSVLLDSSFFLALCVYDCGSCLFSCSFFLVFFLFLLLINICCVSLLLWVRLCSLVCYSVYVLCWEWTGANEWIMIIYFV